MFGIYLFIYLPICLSICFNLYICLYLSVPFCLSTYIFIYLSTYLSIHLSTYLLNYLSTYLSIYLFKAIFISIYLPICLSIYMLVYFSIFLSIFPSTRRLLPVKDYTVGAVLPAHLSPFVVEEEGDYVPPEKIRLNKLIKGWLGGGKRLRRVGVVWVDVTYILFDVLNEIKDALDMKKWRLGIYKIARNVCKWSKPGHPHYSGGLNWI